MLLSCCCLHGNLSCFCTLHSFYWKAPCISRLKSGIYLWMSEVFITACIPNRIFIPLCLQLKSEIVDKTCTVRNWRNQNKYFLYFHIKYHRKGSISNTALVSILFIDMSLSIFEIMVTLKPQSWSLICFTSCRKTVLTYTWEIT